MYLDKKISMRVPAATRKQGGGTREHRTPNLARGAQIPTLLALLEHSTGNMCFTPMLGYLLLTRYRITKSSTSNKESAAADKTRPLSPHTRIPSSNERTPPLPRDIAWDFTPVRHHPCQQPTGEISYCKFPAVKVAKGRPKSPPSF